jgi:5-methylcytosine-specific restriction endonuclease McrA
MAKRKTGAKQRDSVITWYGQNCWWCGCETVISNGEMNSNPPANMFTVDHYIPIAKGGSNELRNLRPSCFTCNGLKGDEIWDDGSVPEEPQESQPVNRKENHWQPPTLGDLWPSK